MGNAKAVLAYQQRIRDAGGLIFTTAIGPEGAAALRALQARGMSRREAIERALVALAQAPADAATPRADAAGDGKPVDS